MTQAAFHYLKQLFGHTVKARTAFCRVTFSVCNGAQHQPRHLSVQLGHTVNKSVAVTESGEGTEECSALFSRALLKICLYLFDHAVPAAHAASQIAVLLHQFLARCNAKLFKVMFRSLLVQFHGLFVSLQADQRLHLDCLPLVERIQFGSNRSQFLQLIELLVFQKILTYFFQCIGIYFFQLRALRLYPLFLAEICKELSGVQLQCFDHLIHARFLVRLFSCFQDLIFDINRIYLDRHRAGPVVNAFLCINVLKLRKSCLDKASFQAMYADTQAVCRVRHIFSSVCALQQSSSGNSIVLVIEENLQKSHRFCCHCFPEGNRLVAVLQEKTSHHVYF